MPFLGKHDAKLFNVFHVNIRSINKNFTSLSTFLATISSCRIDCIALTETWLYANSDTGIFDLPSFNFVHNPRLLKPGGGVGLYVNNGLRFKILPELSISCECLETIFVEIDQPNSKNITIGCLYRPPNTDIANFLSILSSLLSKVDSSKRSLTILTGDFNLDLIKINDHVPTTQFLDILVGFSFFPCISKPTRITNISATLIDNFFIKLPEAKCKSAIVYYDISDHLPIVVQIPLLTKKINDYRSTVCKRVYNTSNIENFNNMLQKIDWHGLLDNYSEVNESYDIFLNNYIETLDKCIPLESVKVSRKIQPREKWMTKNLVSCCIKKSKLYKRAQSSGMEEDKSKFLAYRNKLKSILKKAKKKFFHDQITAAAGNIKNTWKILNSITKKAHTPINTCFKINSSYTSDASIIANNFNTFFSNIGSMLAANISNNSIPFTNYLKDSIPNSCVFWNTDVKEVIGITTQFENKKSAGYDEIPMSLSENYITIISYQNIMGF